MVINKKSEGTASTFLISTIIAFGLLFAIGSFVGNLNYQYQNPQITYFGNYENMTNESISIGKDFTGNYDIQNETSSGWDFIKDRFEDTLFFKAFKVVDVIKNILSTTDDGITQLQEDLGIPQYIVTIILVIMGITLVALIVKVIRGFNNV